MRFYGRLESDQTLAFLYEKHRKLLLRVAWNILQDWQLAEDAVQNAFIRANGQMDRLKSMDTVAEKQLLVMPLVDVQEDTLRAVYIYKDKEGRELSCIQERVLIWLSGIYELHFFVDAVDMDTEEIRNIYDGWL